MKHFVFLVCLLLFSKSPYSQELLIDTFDSDLKKVSVTVGNRDSIYGINGYYIHDYTDDGNPIWRTYTSTPPEIVDLTPHFASHSLHPGRGIVFSERRGSFSSSTLGSDPDYVCGAFTDASGNFVAPHRYEGAYLYKCNFISDVYRTTSYTSYLREPENLDKTFQTWSHSISTNPIAVPMVANVDKIIFGVEHALSSLTGSVSFDIYLRPAVISDLKIYQGETPPESPQTTTSLILDEYATIEAEFYLAEPLYTGHGLEQYYQLRMFLDDRQIRNFWFQIKDLVALGGGKFRLKDVFGINEENGFNSSEDLKGTFRAVVINGEVPLTPKPGEPGFTPEILIEGLDLSISEVKIAQTVYDPDIIPNPLVALDGFAEDDAIPRDGRIDLVLGKPAYAVAKGIVIGDNENSITQIQLALKNESDEQLGNQVVANVVRGQFIGYIPIPTDQQRDLNFYIEIDPANEIVETNEKNNLSEKKLTKINKTYGFSVGYAMIDGCGDCQVGQEYGPAIEVPNSFLQSLTSFLNKTLPLSQSDHIEIVNEDFGWIGGDFLDLRLDKLVGDLSTLDRQRLITNHERFVGLVPKNYFLPLKRGTRIPTGLTSDEGSLKKVALAIDYNPGTFAHELMHTLGQRRDYSATTNGFDVYSVLEIENKIDIMSPLNDLSDIWLSNNTYEKVLKTLLSPSIDPEIVVINLEVGSDGSFEVLSQEEFPFGLLSESEHNENSMILAETLDSDGNILHSIWAQPSFKFILSIENNSSEVLFTDKTQLVLSLPKTHDTYAIQLRSNNGQSFVTKIAPNISSELKTIKNIIESLEKNEVRKPYFVRKFLLSNSINSAIHLEDRQKLRLLKQNLKLLKIAVTQWVRGEKMVVLLQKIESISKKIHIDSEKPKKKKWWQWW